MLGLQVTKEIAEAVDLKKPRGALVASVGEKSPADKAGVKAGDIILEFDEKNRHNENTSKSSCKYKCREKL